MSSPYIIRSSGHLDKDEVDVIINEDLESLPDLLVNLLLAPAIPAAHSLYLFVYSCVDDDI